eukprot:704587-Prorocentrum_lima.AAC.1
MQKLISQEREVKGLQQVEQNLVESIQDTENRVGLEPIRDYEYVANLQPKEELQQVTAFLHDAREEESHQQAL